MSWFKPAALAVGAALVLAGCALLLPPRLAVTPTARVVDVAVGTSTTFTVTNQGAAGSVLNWSFVAAELDAWPASGTLLAGASETVLVTVPSGSVGTTLTGRFAAPRQSIAVSVAVVRGLAITCDPETAFATAPDTVRVLVGYRGDGVATAAARDGVSRTTEAVARTFGATVERRGAGSEFDLLRVPPTGLDALLTALRSRSDVAFAVRDHPIARSAIPNDDLYGVQWNLALFGADPAWDVVDALPTGLDPIVIAIVDDGVAVDHVDLAVRMLPGWDAHANDGDVRNCTDHGTHVAGIAGAGRNDGTGVAGVGSTPWVRLLPVKAWPDTTDPNRTTSTKAIVDAMRWAGGLPVTGFPRNDFPADVINLSLGGTEPALDVVFRPVIDELAARGVVVVAASGNGNSGQEPPVPDGIQYPAASGAIAVGSADHTLERSWFSSFGPGLDLLAPGGFAPADATGCSTVTSTGVTFANGEARETWTCKGGTSMATPYASGAAALLLGLDPALRSSPDRAAAVAARLRDAAALRAGPNTDEYGAGVLCLDALLTTTSVCGVAVGP